MVVYLLEFIHPHFSCPDTVGQSLATGIGCLLREHMADMGTRVGLQGAPTLPDLHTEHRGEARQ